MKKGEYKSFVELYTGIIERVSDETGESFTAVIKTLDNIENNIRQEYENSSFIRLYHGSPYSDIQMFEINNKARSRTDYGMGVYFTTNREQAKKWSIRGNGVTHGYVYETQLDYTLIKKWNSKNKAVFRI